MPSHAERITEAERAVVEAAILWRELDRGFPGGDVAALTAHANDMALIVDALLALRAATCSTCGGTGGRMERAYLRGSCDSEQFCACPAGCEAGKRRDA